MTVDLLSPQFAKKMADGIHLPALPQVALRLLQLSKNPEIEPAEFAVPIESDPGMASQVLHFVNSSYFGFVREISSVRLAIAMVGVRTIKNFTLWSAVFSAIADPRQAGYDMKRAWRDSLIRALFARTIARLLAADDVEEVFSAALLQDVAVPLLVKADPNAYMKLLSRRQTAGYRLSELERHLWGWTHADIGAQICRQWNLPETLVALVENHLASDKLDELAKTNGEAAAVALSSLLPSAIDPHWHEREVFERQYQSVVPAGAPSVVDVFRDVDWQFADLAPVLRIPVNRHALRDRYKDTVESGF